MHHLDFMLIGIKATPIFKKLIVNNCKQFFRINYRIILKYYNVYVNYENLEC